MSWNNSIVNSMREGIKAGLDEAGVKTDDSLVKENLEASTPSDESKEEKTEKKVFSEE